MIECSVRARHISEACPARQKLRLFTNLRYDTHIRNVSKTQHAAVKLSSGLGCCATYPFTCRILCVTPTAVVTQQPDNLTITNTWKFSGESDIDGVGVGPGPTEFTISARKDSRVSTSSDECFLVWRREKGECHVGDGMFGMLVWGKGGGGGGEPLLQCIMIM